MIDPDDYGLVEIVFTGVVVLGLAIWQLWSVNREIARDKMEQERARRKSPEDAGHAVGEHRLDDR